MIYLSAKQYIPFQPHDLNRSILKPNTDSNLRFQRDFTKEEKELLSQTYISRNGQPVQLIQLLQDLEQAIQHHPGPQKNPLGIFVRNNSVRVKQLLGNSILLLLLAITDPKGTLKIAFARGKERYEESYSESPAESNFKFGPKYELQYRPHLDKAFEKSFFQQYHFTPRSSLAIETPLSPIEVAFLGPLSPYVSKSFETGGWGLTENGLRVLKQYSKA